MVKLINKLHALSGTFITKFPLIVILFHGQILYNCEDGELHWG